MTYAQLQAAIKRHIKATGGAKNDLIKDTINMVYQHEICNCDEFYPLFWLRDFDDSKKSVAPATISGITAANPGVITTVAAHGLVDGDIIMLHSIVGMTELNSRLVQVGTVGTTTTFNLEDLDGNNLDTSGYTAYSSGGVVNHHGFKLATTNKDVGELISAKWDGEGKMTGVDIPELEETTRHFDSSTARPTKYMHRKHFANDGTETNQLIWFSGADAAYDLRYWFRERVSALSADADTPMIPAEYHHAIISGVLTRLAENNVSVEQPNVWPGLYKIEIDAIVRYNRDHYKKHEKDVKPYLL